MTKDYYKILGVAEFESAENIKIAYRKLARKWHPDIASNKDEAILKFKEINEAYQTLSDEHKRANYDRAKSFYDYAKKNNTHNINNETNKYTNIFNPNRVQDLFKIVKNMYYNVIPYFTTKIHPNKSIYPPNVKFTKKNGEDVAIYIDEANVEHIVYNKCPHLKCSLIFNEVEKTWDCPCHSSRFDIDGNCIKGPSNYNITYKKKNN